MIAITAHNVRAKKMIIVTINVLFVCLETVHCVESLTNNNDKFLIISFNHLAFLLHVSLS